MLTSEIQGEGDGPSELARRRASRIAEMGGAAPLRFTSVEGGYAPNTGPARKRRYRARNRAASVSPATARASRARVSVISRSATS